MFFQITSTAGGTLTLEFGVLSRLTNDSSNYHYLFYLVFCFFVFFQGSFCLKQKKSIFSSVWMSFVDCAHSSCFTFHFVYGLSRLCRYKKFYFIFPLSHCTYHFLGHSLCLVVSIFLFWEGGNWKVYFKVIMY